MAGNHHLSGGVEIHCFHHFTLCGCGTKGFDLLVFQPQHGSHRARTLRNGRLHQFGAQADESDGIGKRQGIGGNKGGIFAQAVSGDGGGSFAACLQIGAVSRYAGGQHDGLGVDGLADDVGVAAVNHGPQVLAENVGGFVEGGFNDGSAIKAAHHAEALRTLSGKEKCKRHGIP